MRHSLALRAAGLALLVAAPLVAAHAGLDGKYTGKTEVYRHGSDGTIGYTLTLSKDGTAKLEAVRGGKLETSRQLTADYGDLAELLTTYDKLVLVGTWTDLGDNEFRTRFRSAQTKRGELDVDTSLSGDVRDGVVRNVQWDREFFGDEPDLNFKKSASTSHKGDAIVAGTALLALGAIVANNSHRSSGSSRNDYDRSYNDRDYDSGSVQSLNYETGGSGRFQLGGETSSITRARIKLNRGGSGTLEFWTSEGRYKVDGTWNRNGNNVRFTADRVRGYSADGSGTIRMRNSREVSSLFISGKYEHGSRRSNWSASLTAGRG